MTRTDSKNELKPPKLAWRQTIVLEAISKLDPGLYITATPIGNLRDITLRALETLASVDLILCEDTRVSRKLLSAYGIGVPTKAYHDHNGARVRPGILADLAAGRAIALISDAGMPLVSDPGYKLVSEAIEAGHSVTVLPGANAPLTALGMSGLPSDRFAFLGFLPARQKDRAALINEAARLPASLIVFESAQRLAATLAELAEMLGDRPAVVAREMTKKFEQVIRGSLIQLSERMAAGPPKGEMVIVVGPGEARRWTESEVLDALRDALRSLSTKDAAAAVAADSLWPKREVYDLALRLGRDLPR